MSERKRGPLDKLNHASPISEADLRSRRTGHPNTRHTMKHAPSRHREFGENLRGPYDQQFGQGTKFPPHVTTGNITKMQKEVLTEYQKYHRGQPSKVTNVQEAGGAKRVTVKIRRFGVVLVGAFIRFGSICTLFPDDDKR